MWKMGFFADIEVEATDEPAARSTLTFAVKEKPSIRKVYVAGNNEVGLDKINEVLDLKHDTIVESAKVKKNLEKIARPLRPEGLLPRRRSTTRSSAVNEAEVDVWFNIDENAKVEIREVQFIGNNAHLRRRAAAARSGTQEGGWLSFLNDSGTYRRKRSSATCCWSPRTTATAATST